MEVSIGKVLKYSLLPGIIPRIRDLFAAGFSHVAVLMAFAYRAARLLPDGHPYLNPANTGKFGLRHVMSEARRNVIFKKEHIDQVIIYYTMAIGIFLLFFQFVAVFFTFLVNQARADSVGDYFKERFVTQFPQNDLAYMLLDRVFCFNAADGRSAIYNSSVVTGGSCPTPLHTALHSLFHFYNLGALGIALVIFMYFVTTVVAETAQSGTPFGKRFNHAMVPLRLILAIGLLIPLSYGMNGAQLITLYVAKWGSSLATNSWNKFTNELVGQTIVGMPNNLVVKPTAPQLNTLLEYIFVSHTCYSIEKYINRREASLYQLYQDPASGQWLNAPMPDSFNDALANSHNHDIIIRFGELDPAYISEKGSIRPLCGEIVLHVKDVATTGGLALQSGYYDLLKHLFDDPYYKQDGDNIAKRMTPTADRDPGAPIPTIDDLKSDIDYFNAEVATAISNAYAAQLTEERWCVVGQPCWNNSIKSRGWGGAGIWYNKIAELNGGLIAAAFNLPTPTLYPEVMEFVKKKREENNSFVFGLERFYPYLPNGKLIDFPHSSDEIIAVTLYYAQSFWKDVFEKPKGNPFIDTVTALFGIKGLIEISQNVDVHPMAQLVGIGRALVESAVMNLGYSFGSGVLGGLLNIAGMAPLSTVGSATSSFLTKVAMIGLMQGFILFYILPFLPFVYFFFALGSWIKGIFEALIAMPLWAVAHIRIDGQGIPGPVAMNGYYMMLEIFIRPVLTIFGLVASVTFFTAQVRILHAIWPLVIANVTGHNPDHPSDAMLAGTQKLDYFREAGDEFFYMILYTIIVYMLGMGSFKLIDQIPGQILRWIGTSVSNFSDYKGGDAGGDLIGTAFGGGQQILAQTQGTFNTGMNMLMLRNN